MQDCSALLTRGELVERPEYRIGLAVSDIQKYVRSMLQLHKLRRLELGECVGHHLRDAPIELHVGRPFLNRLGQRQWADRLSFLNERKPLFANTVQLATQQEGHQGRAVSLRHDLHLELALKSPVQLLRGLLQRLYALRTQI